MIVMRVEITEDQATQYSRATLRQIMRDTYYQIGLRWQKRFVPLHFKRGNKSRYNLPKRTKRYLDQKRRYGQRGRDPQGRRVEKGGLVNLVYTGLAERLFTKRHAVKAYPTRATINMHGPRYVTMRPYKSQRHNLGEQVLRVIPEEYDDLDQFAGKVLEQNLKRAPTRQRRRRVGR